MSKHCDELQPGLALGGHGLFDPLDVLIKQRVDIALSGAPHLGLATLRHA